MQKFEQSINDIISYIIAIVLFCTPFFFLPITREFLIYSKFYFFFFTTVLLVGLSFIKFLIAKRFFWTKNPFMQAFFLIIFSLALSILLRSPNKIQALFNPNFGFFAIVSMILYYFYSTNAFVQFKKLKPMFLLGLSGCIVSLISLVFLLNPFKNASLSPELSFLKNSYFNPVGNQLELVVFLLFSLTACIAHIMLNRKRRHNEPDTTHMMFFIFGIIIVLATSAQMYTIGKALMTESGKIILPPWSLSWYAVLELFKNPFSALFGNGVDNFASIYTRVRDIHYNMSDLWQISSFSSSRSTVLHILTETGILGLAAFGILLARAYQHSKNARKESTILVIASLIFLILLPPSFMLFFMFFTSLAIFTADIRNKQEYEVYEIDLSQTVAFYIGLLVMYILFLSFSTYFVGRHLLSEVYFKKSIDAVSKNNLKDLYENQRKAVLLNQYNEDFRINFSQTNLLVANNLASKKKEEITEADRQTIAQAIQASIGEAKAAVALNERKVTNWQNLAAIYKNIINVAKDAELWTVSAYQNSIALDPNNPVHRVDLGGVFYLFGNYEEARKQFEQSVVLKPDWSNAHYNLAWSYAQLKDFPKAVAEMQNVLSLLDPKKSEADYKKAVKDIEEFKKNIPQDATESAGLDQNQPADLNLPTPPTATVEPKIELPQTSSPESTEGANLRR